MFDLSTAKKFQFVGGNLALDFCNTVGGKRGGVSREYLNSCFDLLAWCHQAGLLNRAQVQTCLENAERNPAAAAATLARAVTLREALFRIFAAQAAGKPLPRADLALLNAELAQSLGRLQLAPPRNHDALAWRWAGEPGALDSGLGPIAHAAATLLTDAQQVPRLHVCEGDTCGWVFVDTSKNHSRRWCDMRDCGNRAKIRRHRLKQRRARGTIPG